MTGSRMRRPVLRSANGSIMSRRSGMSSSAAISGSSMDDRMRSNDFWQSREREP